MPKSVESIYKVHAAFKSTLVTLVDPHFNVLRSDSFQSNDLFLTHNKINRILLRSELISKYSIKPVFLSPGECSEHDQKFCKLAQHCDKSSEWSQILLQSSAFLINKQIPHLYARSVCNLYREYRLLHWFSSDPLIFSELFWNSRGHIILRTLFTKIMKWSWQCTWSYPTWQWP